MAASDAPRQADLDRCVHCGLCLNACPTYRELGVEMDSPRGRIYQMAQVAKGAPVTDAYREHIDLCLACRACESACPSGVQYGRLIEAARADLERRTERPLVARIARKIVFDVLLPSRFLLRCAGAGMWAYQRLGIQALARATVLKMTPRLREVESLAPAAELPSFYRYMGRVFPAQGERKHRVALLPGCIANIFFARLNEAAVRVLQANGCEVTIPKAQTCCGALHVHSGLRESARGLARQNVAAIADAGFDAILTCAAGCGSTLKEYGELLEDDAGHADRARRFVSKMKDVTEFLASIELNPRMGDIRAIATYQDSCHLAHGQRIRSAPRELLKRIPGLTFTELPQAEICCGSAGIYNVVHTEMAMALLDRKMESVSRTGAQRIVTANPGCMLQLRAGVERHGGGQRVSHVVEILDEAYRAADR